MEMLFLIARSLGLIVISLLLVAVIIILVIAILAMIDGYKGIKKP